jgi:two-component system, chemotaxis family, chemotaxis protein CheY
VGHIVLIVEDDPDIGEALCRVLGDAGHSTRLATDGRKALAFLRRAGSEAPCLILLDLMMPVMDGLRFLAERECDTHLATIPVIVMTAGPTTGVPKSVRVLRKPLGMRRLLMELDRHCSCGGADQARTSAG